MKTEKETIREILVNWGVIKDGVFSKETFNKKVNASWLRKKVLAYGFDKEVPEVKKAVEAAPAEPVVENVCAKCGKNPCECEAEPVKPVEPIVEAPVEEIVDETPAEAPVEAPEAVVETVEAPVEEAPEAVVETVETPVEEAPVDETPAEEAPKTTKKRSSKKK